MTTHDEILLCDNCDAPVRPVPGGAGTFEYEPGIRLPIPQDCSVATCKECGEMYLSSAELSALCDALAPIYAEYLSALVRRVCERGKITRRELARALDIDATYVSHIVSGRKRPGLTLVRLLQAFDRNPTEIDIHLKRESEVGGDTHAVSFDLEFRAGVEPEGNVLRVPFAQVHRRRVPQLRKGRVGTVVGLFEYQQERAATT